MRRWMGWRGGGWRAKIELQGTPGGPREKSPCSGPPKTKILRARRADMPHLNEGVRQELEQSSLLCKERSRSWEVQHFWAPKPQSEPPEDQLGDPGGWPGASVNLLFGLNFERPKMNSPMLLGHPKGPSNQRPDLGPPIFPSQNNISAKPILALWRQATFGEEGARGG